MKDTLYCLDCDNRSYCEHAQMTFCNVNNMPAWMALEDFWDSELEQCIKRTSIASDTKRTEEVCPEYPDGCDGQDLECKRKDCPWYMEKEPPL